VTKKPFFNTFGYSESKTSLDEAQEPDPEPIEGTMSVLIFTEVLRVT